MSPALISTNKQEQWDRQTDRGSLNIQDIRIFFHFSLSPDCARDGFNGGKVKGWGWQTNALLLKDGTHKCSIPPTPPISWVKLNSLHPWKPLDLLLVAGQSINLPLNLQWSGEQYLASYRIKELLWLEQTSKNTKILNQSHPFTWGTEHHKMCSSISTLGYCGTSILSLKYSMWVCVAQRGCKAWNWHWKPRAKTGWVKPVFPHLSLWF